MQPPLDTARAAPTLGLAFGGGGMRGWAHVGVLAVLEELGLVPDVLAGCSAGSVIAAHLARGFSPAEIRQLMQEQNTRGLFSFRFDGQGLLSTKAFRDYLHTHLGDVTFDELDRPLYVSATDLETGKEVVLRSGPVVDAVMASCAMPGIFAPVEHGGRQLVDGGLTNNVPVAPLVTHGATFTVAVQTFRRLARPLPGELHEEAHLEEEVASVDQQVGLATWAGRLRERVFGGEDRGPNAFEVMQRAVEILMTQLEAYRLQSYRPDVLIQPEVPGVGPLAFAEEKARIFQAGADAAWAHADALRRLAAALNGPEG